MSNTTTTEIRVKHVMHVPADIVEIKDVFKENGFELFIVGGAVRDSLKNETIKDYDLVTDAIPDKVEQIMRKSGFKTLPTGKQFGVINVFSKTDEYEIATFRSDGESSDGRRPDSVTFGSIEEDAKRRDLTINALYYDIDKGEVIDFVGGLSDIERNIIRTVGNADDRFEDDELRRMRTVRFAGRYEALLDGNILDSFDRSTSLDRVSPERIRDEFIKAVKTAKSTINLLDMYNQFEFMDYIFKGMDSTIDLIEENDYIVLISFLIRKNPVKLIRKELNNNKYSIAEIQKISFLVSLIDLNLDTAPDLKKQQKKEVDGKLVKIVSDSQILRFCELTDLDSTIVNAFIDYELTVSGQNVIDELGLEGPAIGKMVAQLEKEKFKELI